jgi:putative hydrolase of the HAD superfamily
MRALIFDLDGTLLHSDRSYGSVLETAFESVCGRVEDRWLETYDDAFRDAFAVQEPDPARIAFEATDAPGDPEAFAKRLHEAEIAVGTLPEHARSDLDELADRFPLGVLTNGPDEWQRAKLDAHDLTVVFDAVVTSYGAGAHKPDPAPYRAVESKLSADAYAMIGDSDSDIEGAQRVGWHSVRYAGQRFETVPARLSWEG